MSRSIEDCAHPFKASITSFRKTATLTGEGLGDGDAVGVDVAAGLAAGVGVLVVRLALTLPVLPLSRFPKSSHAPRPAAASTSTVKAIVTGMTSALFFAPCAVDASFGPVAVGRGCCCGAVTCGRGEARVGIGGEGRISVGGGSSPPRPAEFISRVFS